MIGLDEHKEYRKDKFLEQEKVKSFFCLTFLFIMSKLILLSQQFLGKPLTAFNTTTISGLWLWRVTFL